MKRTPIQFPFFAFLLCFFAACGGGADHSSASPEQGGEPGMELSDADRKKMAEAKGKEAKDISLPQLQALLDGEDKKTLLLYFWQAHNPAARKGLEELAALSKDTDPSALGLHLVHPEPGGFVTMDSINTIVRELGMDAELYTMHGSTRLELGGKLRPDGNPLYYIYHGPDKTGIWYAGRKDQKELEALLQPFLIGG